MLFPKLRRIFAVIYCLMLCGPAWGCLWDYDTLAMERQRFPDTLELITVFLVGLRGFRVG